MEVRDSRRGLVLASDLRKPNMDDHRHRRGEIVARRLRRSGKRQAAPQCGGILHCSAFEKKRDEQFCVPCAHRRARAAVREFWGERHRVPFSDDRRDPLAAAGFEARSRRRSRQLSGAIWGQTHHPLRWQGRAIRCRTGQANRSDRMEDGPYL